MNFSVCLIAKNESKTLPRLAESLKEFKERGGEIILLDTGSTDATIEIAKSLGFVVYGVGDRFTRRIGSTARLINKEYCDGEDEIVKEDDTVFNYSEARNYVASLAKNDMIAMPDCDEVYTSLDLDGIQRSINEGAEQLEYNFVYSHDEFGKEAIKFRHCKFYNRKKLRWSGIIHEVLQGSANRVFLGEEIVKLEHFQNKETNRSGYLKGLALDCFLNPQNDRNSHYFGRELMYSGRYKSAIKELKRHLTIGKWTSERAQSMVFIGDCFSHIGNNSLALSWWNKAYAEDPDRREPFIRLASHYYYKRDPKRTAAYCEAMLTIPGNDFYANNKSHYEEYPHELAYWAYWQLGNREKSKEHFAKAFAFQPKNYKYRADYRFYYPNQVVNPSISIVIPTLGRKNRLKRLLEAIETNAEYENYEVIVIHDGEESNDPRFYDLKRTGVYESKERRGVPLTLKDGVNHSQGELIMFLGNDCIPEKGFLRKAVDRMYREFGLNLDGLIGLNDGYWMGEIATHWLGSRKLLEHLDGEFFHTGYHHVGCDNELTARCKKIGKYVWAEEVKVFHDHPIQNQSLRDEIYDLGLQKQSEDRGLLKQRAQELGFELLENFIYPHGILSQ